MAIIAATSFDVRLVRPGLILTSRVDSSLRVSRGRRRCPIASVTVSKPVLMVEGVASKAGCPNLSVGGYHVEVGRASSEIPMIVDRNAR